MFCHAGAVLHNQSGIGPVEHSLPMLREVGNANAVQLTVKVARVFPGECKCYFLREGRLFRLDVFRYERCR